MAGWLYDGEWGLVLCWIEGFFVTGRLLARAISVLSWWGGSCLLGGVGSNELSGGFWSFASVLCPFCTENEEKMHILQKKSRKCFVVKKKAIPLHSLYNGNSATNDDRLFSSVGQSTWFVISGSLVRIRQEAQIKRKRISLWSCRKCVFWNSDKVRANSRVAKWGRL